ncbi:MAG TPA: acyltransferase [Ktedonobacterales bacterium]|nr:acyltransferase [Ktedonobacterales bacterium]
MAQGWNDRVRAVTSQWRERLIPLSTGPHEIRAMDGLRAAAALSVLVYHALASTGARTVVFGHDVTWAWFYTESGVDLFFVLSGFLLFLPYARAMLQGRPLPGARQFYRRRALRILPAYWVCLAILVLIQLPTYASSMGIQNILAHVVLLHDDNPAFSRAIEGPFWTLAVEAQFYVVLPLFALCIARLVGATRSARRVILGICGVIVVALALRELDAVVAMLIPRWPPETAARANIALNFLTGAQGKYLEVFAVGMLCSVVYILAIEEHRWSRPQTLRAGSLLFLCSIGIYLVLAQAVIRLHNLILAPYYLALRPWDVATICGPLFLGVGYGALVLGVLLGSRAVRGPFEAAPLRFIGLISYSLYLWHEPILEAFTPHFAAAPLLLRDVGTLAVGVFIAIPVAYMSYQLVERPFLRRRHRTSAQITSTAGLSIGATQPGAGA